MTGRRLFILGNSFSKPIPLNPFPFLYIPQFSRFTLLVYLTLSHQANTYDGYAGSYTLYDAAVRYDLGQLNGSLKGVSVAVNANNLFNKDYLASCDGYYCYYGDQRSVVGSVSYKW